MKVFVQKYIKNSKCNEILPREQIYISLNILTSNNTCCTGTIQSEKLLQLVKKFTAHKKNTSWLIKKAKFRYHSNTEPGKSLAFFCSGSAEVVGEKGMSEASKSGRYSFTVQQPLHHPHWVLHDRQQCRHHDCQAGHSPQAAPK